MAADLASVEFISFDLFETLVDGEIHRLPRIEWRGRRIPSTAGPLLEHLQRRHPVELVQLMTVMREIDRELRAPRHAAGRELPNHERFEAVVARLGLEDPGLAEELGEIHTELVREHIAMPDHHPGLLARLARHRRLALCSNFSHSPTALRILAERGLSEHLDPVVISDEVDSRKPARPIFEALLERLGLALEHAHRVLHVGDRLDADVAGAAAVGMRTAWITRSVRDRDAAVAGYEGPSPDLELADLGELEQALGAPAAAR